MLFWNRSTSQNHAIWVNEFVCPKNSDLIRFYLTLHRPEFFSSAFKMTDFKHFETTFWQGTLLSLINDLKPYSVQAGSVLAEAGQWEQEDKVWYYQALELHHFIKDHYRLDQFNPMLIARRVIDFCDGLFVYFKTMQPFFKGQEINENVKRTKLRVIFFSLVGLGVALAPICPNLATVIAKILGQSGTPELAWLDADHFKISSADLQVNDIKTEN